MIYGIIYKYTSPSGGIYIGQTINTIEKRKTQHIHDVKCGSTKIFHNAIRKYGIETFKQEILQEAYSKEELNSLEIYYIEKYNSYYKNNTNGYNMTIGGEGANGYIRTENDKQKLSLALKQYYIDNPQVLSEMSERTKEHNKKNPEKLIQHSQHMKYIMNLPENKNRSTNTFKKFRDENPDAISIQQKEIWAREGYKEKMSNTQKEYLENNPEEKQKRIDRLKKSVIDNPGNHSKFMKELSNRPEKKEKFKILIFNDREKNAEKYKIANEKKKEKMNTQEFKEKMSLLKRKTLNIFEVFDKDGNLLGEFDNTIDCIKILKLPKSPSIVKCLNNKLSQSCGYKFKYKSINS
jgi:group I intron endonuclease